MAQLAEADYQVCLKQLGLKVGYYRRKAGLTQEQLAELVGISWAALSKIERGISGCKMRTLWNIAETLGTPAANFLDVD